MGIEQCYLMPTRRRVNGKRQPGRSRTDHRQIFFLHGQGRLVGGRPRSRARSFADENLIEAGLIAAKMQVFISSAGPIALLTAVPHQQNGRAMDTISASPRENVIATCNR
ncbi:hypothetical protein ACNKHX_18960 [Shigella flexneri]